MLLTDDPVTTDDAWTIDVLSVAKGDMRLSFTGDTPEERAKASATIQQMLTAGYTIFVETKAGLRRVKKYNPKRNEYVIVDVPSPTASRPEKAVPARGTRAKAIGATAGG